VDIATRGILFIPGNGKNEGGALILTGRDNSTDTRHEEVLRVQKRRTVV
jgi:hypothetical protein